MLASHLFAHGHLGRHMAIFYYRTYPINSTPPAIQVLRGACNLVTGHAESTQRAAIRDARCGDQTKE